MTSLRPMKLLKVDPASTVASANVGVEPTTGGASVAVPIPLTPGRDGFGPSLGLTFGGYDPLSPFPHGWSLAGLPSIDIDVRDGLPAYDGTERFRFQGQDLVPLEDLSRPTEWTSADGSSVRAFRARIEALPIRAEQWTDSEGRVHWRVRTGDGTVRIYGRRTDDESRIADPADPRRTYRWLLESVFDRLGNATLVRYLPEDGVGVDPTSSDASRFAAALANRYPKRILYGNAAPLAEDDTSATIDAAEWYFETVFDYGDHDTVSPQPAPDTSWPVRQDAGFTGRMGFEVRTRRLARRVLMFHHFSTELGEASTLVGSLELDLAEAADATTLSGVRYVGWRTESGARVSQATPWATFAYTDAGAEDAFAVVEAPLLGAHTQLVDLFGEGLPGLLTPDPSGVRYASNLGDGAFGAHELLPAWPMGVAGGTLADFDGDGNVELVALTGQGAGYYRLDRRSRTWEPLRRFDAALNLDSQHGVVRQADLSGDGRPDVVFFHQNGITWFPNEGTRGFGEPVEVRLPAEKMPAASGPLDRFLADMTGDGLADIVEVLNGSVRYWPNLGRGVFGDPVVMDGAPRLDSEGSYDAARVLLVDLDSTGSADLIYLRGDGTVLRAQNQRGTSFGPLEPIAWGAPIPNGTAVQLVDLYGDGSRCLVWTGPSGAGAAAFHALRLTSSPGARQMLEVTHPLGATTALEWGHSVRHYLRDVASGRGWDTPLPSQRPVVDVVRRTEPIDGQEKSERYAYHDGHYDARERTFALFAVVEQLDVDTESGVIDVTPLLTRRFSHTGEYDYTSRFARHHYAPDLEARPPPESRVQDPALLNSDFEEAFRVLMGSPVRQEVYGTDAQGVPGADPFTVAASSRLVRLTRAADAEYRTAVQVVEADAIERVYEQDPNDPRETLRRTLEVDAYLTPLVTFEAGLPRTTTADFAAQARLLATASKSVVTHVDDETRFELAIPSERRAYEVHVPTTDDAFADTLDAELSAALTSAIPYDQSLNPDGLTLAARELSHERVYYWDDTFTSALPLGGVGTIALPHHSDQSAYDRDHLVSVFGTRVDPDTDLAPLGFVADGDVFYAQGPITRFAGAADFYRLTESEAFDGGVQEIVPDAYRLCAQQAIDEVGNTTTATIDYHVLAPWQLTDPNGTVQEIDYDPLGVARRTSRYGTAMDATGTLVAHGFTALTRGQARPTIDDALADPETALGEAEHLIVYELPTGGAPMRTLTLAAEQFVDRGPDAGSAPARAQVGISYLDGFGRALQQRTLVDPGTAWTVDPGTGELVETSVTERWLVSGYTAFDRKQQPIQQYEPFFRDGPAFDPELSLRQLGVSGTTHYDALGRTVRQDFPNGTFTQTVLTPWSRTSSDPNDTSSDATDYVSARSGLPSDDPEYIALQQALSNDGTPITVHLDALGREIASVERIESSRELTEETTLEIRGLSEATIDRRGLTASTRSYDRLGRVLLETSMDAGEHRSLFDAKGQEPKHWHEETEELRVFDLAGRLTERHVTDSSTSWLAETITYGEGATGAADRNQLGRPILVRDGAGEASTPRYGAFGEPLETTRTLTASSGLEPDWSSTVALETSGYTSVSAYDALGRPARALLPDGTERQEDYLRMGPVAELRVITPDAVTRTILTGTEYNARGQQIASTLGNDVEVTSVYDSETFRLYQRRAVLPGTDPYQDLRHHYDPSGNLVYLDDLAQTPSSSRVINGLTVTAERTYTYDARYQLTEATGRVHNALTQPDFRGDTATSGSFRGTRRIGLNDGGAVARYRRTYSYDDAGNIQSWSHGPEVGGGAGNSWNSEKWVSSTSNRSFPAYDLNGIAVSNPGSNFNARGQLTSLPSLRSMEWSARDLLRRAVLIERTTASDDDETYDYAADGTRVRKTLNRVYDVDNDLVETTETIYLDGCELRRIRRDSGVILERWSSHVADGDQRVATLYRWDSDTLARETDDVTAVRTHYHIGTHLGSVALELDASGGLLSYEEYFPYGRTAFLAGDSVTEMQFRTRRYVGKDQDDATGFYVFQYRYYAPFLGNWVSPDPAGEVNGPNLYQYVGGNPINIIDAQGLSWGFDWDFDPSSGSITVSVDTPFASARASVSAHEGVSTRVEASGGSLDVQVSSEGARVEVQTPERSARLQVDSQGVEARVETPEVRARAEVSRRRGIDVAVETSQGSAGVHVQDPIGELERAAQSDDPVIASVAGTALTGLEIAESAVGEVRETVQRAWTDFRRGLTGDSPAPTGGDVSLAEMAGRGLRENETAQLLAGATMGGLAGALPGGFLFGLGLEASGTSQELPRNIMIGYGAGEMLWGIAQAITGIGIDAAGGGMMGGGAGATSTGAGAPVGAPAMVIGGVSVTAGTALIAEAGFDVLTGLLILMQAAKRPPDHSPPPPAAPTPHSTTGTGAGGAHPPEDPDGSSTRPRDSGEESAPNETTRAESNPNVHSGDAAHVEGQNAAASAARHGDFHGPWRPDDPKADWGQYLRDVSGTEPPAEMYRPHAHHILPRNGLGRTQRALVAEGQDILRRRAGIDPIYDPDNLVWAPNARGVHRTDSIRRVVQSLRDLDAANGTPEQFRKLLRQLGREAAAR